MIAGFIAYDVRLPIVGIGVSRDPADQTPLVRKEAQAVCDLLDLGVTIGEEDVRASAATGSRNTPFRTRG